MTACLHIFSGFDPGGRAGLESPALPLITSSVGVEELHRLPVGGHQGRPGAEDLCPHLSGAGHLGRLYQAHPWAVVLCLHPLGVEVVPCPHLLEEEVVLCHHPEEVAEVPYPRPWGAGEEVLSRHLSAGDRLGRPLSGDHQGHHPGA